jgi:DNA replication and repair protein RecF
VAFQTHPALFLRSIQLTNFKNYLSARIDFSEKVNCIVGLNGSGKTNLLDAVYYLCMCKSRLVGLDRHVVRQSQDEKSDFFRLEGHFMKNAHQELIVMKVMPPSLKEVTRNGVPYERLSDHIGLLPLVFVVPDDANLLLEGSDSRRQLMDNVLSQMSQEYLKSLVAYNRILQQRNSALKSFQENGRTVNHSLLDTYNQQMLGPAGVIFQQRKRFAEIFEPIFAEIYSLISGSSESVSCTYESELQQSDMHSLLRTSVERDIALGRTTTGIHRDDLAFGMDRFPLKRFASQGQLKSFALSVKLAQYDLLRHEKAELPILLLDDIFDKLDDNRVSRLLELLHEERFGQIFLTDTHEHRAEEILRTFSGNYRKFVISSGTVVQTP